MGDGAFFEANSVPDQLATQFCANILDVAKVEDQFSAVLLRKRLNPWEYAYYFNLRPENDNVYSSRVGLFGGKPFRNESTNERVESWLACAYRELQEETKLTRTDVSALEPLCDLSGKNSRNDTTVGAIYFADVERHVSKRVLRRNVRERNQEIRLNNENLRPGQVRQNEVGDVYVVRVCKSGKLRIPNLKVFTPQAAFALITAIDKHRR